MKKTLFSALLVVAFGCTALAGASEGQERGGREAREAADRVRGDGERASNRGDREGARSAERAAREIERNRDNPDKVRDIERDYNRGNPVESGPRRDIN